ncbi:hypothetical protein [Brevibacillus sp. 179-C9.3 HS]|uniref:hypothetical protein n=1 Tax=unclassified Brevibacillus TaxID=2684853 RepID=UPI00399F7607
MNKVMESSPIKVCDQPFFIAVYCYGGIISSIEIGTDLVELWREMRRNLYANFDGEVDDARIFNQNSEEVYYFNEDEERMEFYCSKCLLINNLAKDDEQRCSCGMKLTPLF